MQVKICNLKTNETGIRVVELLAGQNKLQGIANEPKDGFVIIHLTGDERLNDPPLYLKLNDSSDIEVNKRYEHQARPDLALS